MLLIPMTFSATHCIRSSVFVQVERRARRQFIQSAPTFKCKAVSKQPGWTKVLHRWMNNRQRQCHLQNRFIRLHKTQCNRLTKTQKKTEKTLILESDVKDDVLSQPMLNIRSGSLAQLLGYSQWEYATAGRSGMRGQTLRWSVFGGLITLN